VAQGGGAYIPVVPGSETVWLNGKTLRRGRDYQFEPVGGVLDFLGGIFPSSRDLIRIEYEEYTDKYSRGFAATDAWMRLGPLRVQWAGSRLWADLREARRRLQDSTADSSSKAAQPEDLRLGGARAQWNAGFLGKLSVEGAVSRWDPNSLSDSIVIRDGFAGRWRLYSQEEWSQIRPGLQWEYTGAWQDSLFHVGEQRGYSKDWERWDLREHWELDSIDTLEETRRLDIIRVGFAPTASWRPWVGWGYRAHPDGWNSQRRMAGLDHHSNSARSTVELSQVEAFQNGIKKQQQAQYEAEFLQQWVRPFSEGSYVERQQQPWNAGSFHTREYQLTDGIHYGTPLSGVDATLQGGAQALQRDNLAGQGWGDSLQSVQVSHQAQLGNTTFGASSLLQWKRLWGVAQAGSADMWLSEQSLNWNTVANQGQASHKLGLTRERALIPSYQAVAQGTGNVLYDSLLQQYVEGVDQGNFIRDGSVPSDSLPWTVLGEVALKVDEWWSPGLAFNIARGLLRDIRLGARGEWRETDSLQLKYMPPFFWDDLDSAQNGLSQNEGMFEWTHPMGYADMQWNFGGAKEKQKLISELRERRWWLEGTGTVRFPESWRHSVEWRRELVKVDAPSAMYWLVYDTHLHIRKDLPWDWSVEPGFRLRTSTGESDWGSLQARLVQPSFALMRVFNGNGEFRSEYSFSWMKPSQDIIPWRVMDGFAAGWTHRVETTFAWTVREKVQISLGHVLRVEQKTTRPFQKFSGEAKAFF